MIDWWNDLPRDRPSTPEHARRAREARVAHAGRAAADVYAVGGSAEQAAQAGEAALRFAQGWTDDEAIDRAEWIKREAAAALAVEQHAARPRVLGPYDGDAGAPGVARGPIEAVGVMTVDWCERAGELVARTTTATRRRGPSALSRAAPERRAAAERYAGLAERASSIRAPGEGRGSGVSDGGATARCADVDRFRAARTLVGSGVALSQGRGRPVLDLEIVDAVAIEGAGFETILRVAGWAVTPQRRDALRAALWGSLDRLARHFGFAT